MKKDEKIRGAKYKHTTVYLVHSLRERFYLCVYMCVITFYARTQSRRRSLFLFILLLIQNHGDRDGNLIRGSEKLVS